MGRKLIFTSLWLKLMLYFKLVINSLSKLEMNFLSITAFGTQFSSANWGLKCLSNAETDKKMLWRLYVWLEISNCAFPTSKNILFSCDLGLQNEEKNASVCKSWQNKHPIPRGQKCECSEKQDALYYKKKINPRILVTKDFVTCSRGMLKKW